MFLEERLKPPGNIQTKTHGEMKYAFISLLIHFESPYVTIILLLYWDNLFYGFALFHDCNINYKSSTLDQT